MLFFKKTNRHCQFYVPTFFHVRKALLAHSNLSLTLGWSYLQVMAAIRQLRSLRKPKPLQPHPLVMSTALGVRSTRQQLAQFCPGLSKYVYDRLSWVLLASRAVLPVDGSSRLVSKENQLVNSIICLKLHGQICQNELELYSYVEYLLEPVTPYVL